MAKPAPRCRYCGGALLRDGDDVICLTCGREHRTNSQIHGYIKANEKEILADNEKLGMAKTGLKWGVSSSTVWAVIQNVVKEPAGSKPPAPGTTGKNQAAGLPVDRAVPGPIPANNNGQVAGLIPTWSDNWSWPVQLEYLKLLRLVYTNSIQKGGNHES